jgi:nucleoid DNA-binding protein
MASIRDAIRTYAPDLDLEAPVLGAELVAHLAEQTGLEGEVIEQVLAAFQQTAFWFLVRGRPIELAGVGQLKPAIRLDGKIQAALDTDQGLIAKMSETDAYRAGIRRRESIGVPLARLAQMWNSSHPSDPVTDLEAYAVRNT